MALSDEVVSYVKEEIRRSGQAPTMTGTVTSLYPLQVRWDGAANPVGALVRTDYSPQLYDRVVGLRLPGGSVVCIGAWVASDGTYGGKIVQANLDADFSFVAGSYDLAPVVNDDNSDDSWVIKDNGFYGTPQAVGSIWRVNLQCRWQSSAATSTTSWVYVSTYLSYRDSADNFHLRRVCVAQSTGHAAGTAKEFGAVGPAFYVPQPPDNNYVLPFVTFVLNSSVNSTFFAQSYTGAQEITGPFAEAGPATYMQLERMR